MSAEGVGELISITRWPVVLALPMLVTLEDIREVLGHNRQDQLTAMQVADQDHQLKAVALRLLAWAYEHNEQVRAIDDDDLLDAHNKAAFYFHTTYGEDNPAISNAMIYLILAQMYGPETILAAWWGDIVETQTPYPIPFDGDGVGLMTYCVLRQELKQVYYALPDDSNAKKALGSLLPQVGFFL